jgi:hypothetical protein
MSDIKTDLVDVLKEVYLSAYEDGDNDTMGAVVEISRGLEAKGHVLPNWQDEIADTLDSDVVAERSFHKTNTSGVVDFKWPGY